MIRAFIVLLVACSSPPRPAPTPTNVAAPPVVEAKPAAVAVQLGYHGTFMIGPPFTHQPPFTLLDDGTLITIKEHAISTARLSRAEVDGIVKRVRDLGFARLESYTSNCSRPSPTGTRVCVSDGSLTVLRVGEREITTYEEFSNEPETHRKIVAYLAGYQHASAMPYRPTFGALHVRVADNLTKRHTTTCPAIDPALLRIEKGQTIWAFRIDGQALAAVLAIAPAKHDFFACADGAMFQLTFVAGIPGWDLSGELDVYKRRK